MPLTYNPMHGLQTLVSEEYLFMETSTLMELQVSPHNPAHGAASAGWPYSLPHLSFQIAHHPFPTLSHTHYQESDIQVLFRNGKDQVGPVIVHVRGRGSAWTRGLQSQQQLVLCRGKGKLWNSGPSGNRRVGHPRNGGRPINVQESSGSSRNGVGCPVLAGWFPLLLRVGELIAS